VYCSRCGHAIDESARFCPSCGLDLAVSTPVARVTEHTLGERSEADLVREALDTEYEILEELGRGGMAIVFRAREKQLERDVAIKVLPFSLSFDAEFVERFQREARTAARLEHPNIIPIYRVGRAGRVIYFVMKLVRGTSLSEILGQRGTLGPSEIRPLLAQAANALGYAHRHGIVHRDIKPDNIMFDEMGHVVVTDFGIAKAASGTRLTGTGMSIGTPHYMSPEQARAQPLDGRGDLYSLGVVAYQCLAGQVPFDGEDAFSIGYKHIMDELPVPPLETAEARRLFAVIRRMMAKAPEDRYQSAEDLVRDLEVSRPSAGSADEMTTAATVALPALEDVRPSAATPRPSGARADTMPPPSTPTTPAPRSGLGAAHARRRRGGGLVVVASVALLLGGGGIGGYFLYTNYLAPPPPPPPRPPVVLEPLVVWQPPLDSATGAARLTANRAHAARMAALPDSGWLRIVGAPDGARYVVQDRPYQTNLLWLDVGTQQVRVRASGYTDFVASVAVPKADTVELGVTMARLETPAPARPSVVRPEPRPPGAEAQCERPGAGYNADGSCFDSAARLLGSGSQFVRLDASVRGEPPRRVTIFVRVGPDGRATFTAAAERSDESGFVVLARRHAMGLRYQPATKAGRPVEAWAPFLFFPQDRER